MESAPSLSAFLTALKFPPPLSQLVVGVHQSAVTIPTEQWHRVVIWTVDSRLTGGPNLTAVCPFEWKLKNHHVSTNNAVSNNKSEGIIVCFTNLIPLGTYFSSICTETGIHAEEVFSYKVLIFHILCI